MGSIFLTLVEAVGRQQWLDPFADRAQPWITKAYQAGGRAGLTAKNAMHGVWLGHSLHPVLTDVVIGSWTAAAVFDTLDAAGQKDLRRAADAAVGLGLVSAPLTMLTGLTDWSATNGRARRQGLVHGLLNLSLGLLYLTSFRLRRSGRRAAGRSVAFAAYAIANVSAYLGGHLVYGEQVGVDHTVGRSLPDAYTPVLAAADLPESQPTRVQVDGVPVVLVRQAGTIYALAETCAHLGGPLADGHLEGATIICPWHGSQYRLSDGRVLNGPSTFDQPCFVARVRDGQIEVRGA